MRKVRSWKRKIINGLDLSMQHTQIAAMFSLKTYRMIKLNWNLIEKNAKNLLHFAIVVLKEKPEE